MSDNGKIIVTLSNAIIGTLDCIEDANVKHFRGALLRALMVYYIRGGYDFDDFKAMIDRPTTAACYRQEVENENT